MKKTPLVILLVTCLLILLIVTPTSQPIVHTGAISFESLHPSKEEFTIKIHTTIVPNTRIIFTDTEWNGSYFGIDEQTMIWNTGKDTLFKESSIHFQKHKSKVIVSKGSTIGALKLHSKREAIFAYQGTDRMPTHFIAGIAHHISDYGTLQNTGLIVGSTALVLP